MMFASVIQWKKHHPTHFCQLHADSLTIDFFNDLKVLELWDNVVEIGINKLIDKSVFWSSSKLQALRNVNTPIIIMDNDFIVYKSFEDFINDKIVVAHDEDGDGYYLNALDGYIKQVKHLINRPKLLAINCSFLYFPDPTFTQSYAMRSLELMQEFTKIKAPNSKYLIYSEQLLLKHMLDMHNIKYDCLIDRVYDCSTERFIKKTKGLIKYKQAFRYYRHYWKEKNKIRDNKEGFSLKEETEQLENLVKNRILIDWSILND